VPDAKTARVSVMWAMMLIGAVLHHDDVSRLRRGHHRRAQRDRPKRRHQHERAAAGASLGGDVFFAFISAVAFATILAVVAGLTISASTSFAHDFYTNVIHGGTERSPGEEVRVARITAFVVGAVSILIASLGPARMWRSWWGWRSPSPPPPTCR
jgi:cation/acetate symporter